MGDKQLAQRHLRNSNKYRMTWTFKNVFSKNCKFNGNFGSLVVFAKITSSVQRHILRNLNVPVSENQQQHQRQQQHQQYEEEEVGSKHF